MSIIREEMDVFIDGSSGTRGGTSCGLEELADMLGIR